MMNFPLSIQHYPNVFLVNSAVSSTAPLTVMLFVPSAVPFGYLPLACLAFGRAAVAAASVPSRVAKPDWLKTCRLHRL